MNRTQRNQIFAGTIGAIVVIAGLHLLVFKERAKQYNAAKSHFDTVLADYQNTGGALALPKVYEFQYQTINHELDFYSLMKDLSLTLPPEFFKHYSIDKQREDFVGFMDELMKLRDEGANPDKKATVLTFLGERGWDIRAALPEDVTKGGVDVGDHVRRLSDTNEVIKVLSTGTPLLQQKKDEYKRLLRTVGIDVDRRDKMGTFFGPTTSLLYSLNRAELVKKALPRDFFGARIPDKEFTERLYSLLRLEWPKSASNEYKQMDSLLDIIKRARTHGIEEITSVKLWETRDLMPPDKDKDKAQKGPQFDPDGNPIEEDSPANQAAAAKASLGSSNPIELVFKGPNSAVMAFLYDLGHCRRPYEVDAIEINSQPNKENQVVARAVVGVTTFVAPPAVPLLESTELQDTINDALSRKVAIATKGGARELAEKEGFDPVKVGASLPPAKPKPAEATTP